MDIYADPMTTLNLQISTGSAYLTLILLIGLVALLVGVVVGLLGYKIWGTRSLVQRLQLTAIREAERAKESERHRLNAIYNLIYSLTASLNYKRVLDSVLDLSTSVLGTPEQPAASLVSAVLLFAAKERGQTELMVGSARRFTPADSRTIFPGAEGLVKRVIDEGEPVISHALSKDPELGRVIALRACKVAYGIPLRVGLETYGILLFAHPDFDFFTPNRREILEVICQQAVIAIQNARLYSDLKQEQERMMEIQEEARKKLARDLHDGPTQSVAAIAMRVNFARRLMEKDVNTAGEELFKVEELARNTTKEIRHMLFTLRPLVLESQGLLAALEAMADKMRETYKQNVIIDVDSKIAPRLEINKQTVVFYIAEEAINNARKYAQAEHIWVRLKSLDSDLALLEIQDDGVGFNLEAINISYNQRGSLGLVNIRERAELVNGILHMESVEGKGTRIQVIIPLTEEAIDRLRKRVTTGPLSIRPNTPEPAKAGQNNKPH